MERLTATLEVRSTNDELREFEGIASSSALDDHGTIIEPNGARFSLPIPLLWFHDQKTPVGEITHAELRGGKWWVRGNVRLVTEPGKVKDATDQAWHSLKYKLVRGLSIGFTSLKEKGNRFIEWAWRELSLVTIPSNQEASILAVRSAYIAASGEKSPGVSGLPTKPNPRHGKMTIQEQISQHENSRAAKVARQSALMDAAGAAGETLGETEAEEYDTLTREVDAIDGHLTRLSTLNRANAAAATPINGTSIAKASEARSGVPVVRTRSREEPGIGFARYVMSLAACNGNRYEAAQYARETFGDGAEEIAVRLRSPKAQLHTRAAIAPGTTQEATFAAPLVATNFLNEFLELLRPATLIGRIPGLRKVPFNISMPSQTAGGTYKWVGEGKNKPLTNAQFAAVTLGMNKASGIIVLTEELVRSSTPAAQEVVRNELVQGITQFLDGQFIDPAVSAVANVNPASITNGIAGTAASGTTPAAANTDLVGLIGGFVTGNFGIGSVVLLMNEGVAFTLAMMRNTDGSLAYPGLSATGGTLAGQPVVTSNVITNDIFAVHTPSILVADEGGVEVDVSREATLQMDSAPDEPADADTVLISMFQANLVALRGERFISWGKARTGAVRRIHTVAYVA